MTISSWFPPREFSEAVGRSHGYALAVARIPAVRGGEGQDAEPIAPAQPVVELDTGAAAFVLVARERGARIADVRAAVGGELRVEADKGPVAGGVAQPGIGRDAVRGVVAAHVVAH